MINRSTGEPRPAAATPLYQRKADLFKTLAHPARIRILELLAERDRSVSELLPEIGLESSHLSQQLGVLRRAGVVAGTKRGNLVIYALATPDIADLLAVARTVLSDLLSDQVGLFNDLHASGETSGQTRRRTRS